MSSKEQAIAELIASITVGCAVYTLSDMVAQEITDHDESVIGKDAAVYPLLSADLSCKILATKTIGFDELEDLIATYHTHVRFSTHTYKTMIFLLREHALAEAAAI